MPLPGQFLSIWDCPRIWSDILWLCPLGSWYNQQCVAQWWSPMHFDCRNGSSCYLFRFETGVHVWSGLTLQICMTHYVAFWQISLICISIFRFLLFRISEPLICSFFLFFRNFCFCTGSIISADFSAMCRIPVFAIFLKSVFSWLENSSLLAQSCVSAML